MNFKENETLEKLRGGYYTPLPMAQFLVNWVLEGKPNSILEPSCGDGVFLTALYENLSKSANPYESSLRIKGIELVQSEVQKSRRIATKLRNIDGIDATVCEADFFSWILKTPNKSMWDAIIGNPPYIRYQYFDENQQIHAAKIFSKAGLKFSKRTNAWVPFVVASVMRLSEGGRLAMVLPSELLHILHAHGLRNFLEQEMMQIDILDVRELAFAGALQGVLLFRAIKYGTSSTRVIRSWRVNPRIERVDSASDLKNHVQLQELSDRQPLLGRWTHALLNAQEFDLVTHLQNEDKILSFKDIASVDIGIVTGANKYFVVDAKTVERYELQDIAKPMLARSEFLQGITYTTSDQKINHDAGKPVLFLQFPDVPKNEMPALMREYIEIGEGQGLHKRYKTSMRTRWYVVPYVWTSELAMLKRCHLFPNLVLNQARAYSTDTAYRVRLKSEYADKARHLVFSFLNSLTLLTAELEGRYYGGGVLELVPSEIEKLSIPLVKPTKAQFSKVDQLLRDGAEVDKLLAYTDQIILRNILSDEEISVLRSARKRLQDRRLRN